MSASPTITAPLMSTRWLRYYSVREPVAVFSLDCHERRKFLAYTQQALLEVRATLAHGAKPRAVYKTLCEDSLALGNAADIVALPLDSPEWTRVGKRWRPLPETPAEKHDAAVVAWEEFFREGRRTRKKASPRAWDDETD